MWKTTQWPFLGKNLRRRPLLVIGLSKNAESFPAAADIELALVTGDAFQRAVVAGLATIFPLYAASVTIDAPGIEVAVSHACPIVGPSDYIQVTIVDNHGPHAGSLGITD